VWGCVTQLGDPIGKCRRFDSAGCGLAESIPGVTINRECGSGKQAVEFAAMGVMSGRSDLVIAGGVATMSRVPIGATRAVGYPMERRCPRATTKNWDSNRARGPR